MRLPYLTSEFPGIGGTLRNRPEDFFVQEIPAYEPSGAGEHVMCEIQKVGMTTFDAVEQIGRILDIPAREIGFAGMKDADAVSRQHLTIPRVEPERLMAIQTPRLAVLHADRHGNKLRLGHLKGNRFAIKIRDVEPTHVVRLRPILDRLEHEGMPNFFGEQRFGRRGDNDRLGAALLREDHEELIQLLLGNAIKDVEPSNIFEARRYFDNADYSAAMHKWPRSSGMERRILARFINTKSAFKAQMLIEPKLRRLWMSALQSRVFNDVVSARLDSLSKVMVGDLAYLHDRGACFSVEDLGREQPRAQAFEISATGPMLGYRMSMPSGEPMAIELAVFDRYRLTREEFKRSSHDKAKGDRRPVRVRPTDTRLSAGTDEHGAHVTVAFTLPAGSFATVLMGELMKTDALSAGHPH